MADAILYIVWNLRNIGYKVSYTHPNFLFITWQDYDDRYRTSESPWSQVLNTARAQVLSGAATPTTVSHVVKPQATTAPSAEITKRKTILKKTDEFKPSTPSTGIRTTNPGIVGIMMGGGAPPPPAERLPGQLSEKHVSFV